MNLIDILFSRALIASSFDEIIRELTAAKADAEDVSASASVNAAGLISFMNSDGTTLFTLQLPMYYGAVETPVQTPIENPVETPAEAPAVSEVS